MSSSRRLLGLFLIAILAWPLGRIIGRTYNEWQERRRIAATWPELLDSSATLGRNVDDDTWNGPVLVEFVDYQCASCRRLANSVSDVAASGRARVVIRHFPMDELHGWARDAARAAICATKQGAFPRVHEMLLTETAWIEQRDWTSLAGKANVPEIGNFARCMSDPSTDKQIENDIRTAERLRVRGTPTFVTKSGLFEGASGLAEALATMRPPGQTVQEDERVGTLHVGKAAIFDSFLHPESSVSRLGRLAGALFVDEQRLLIGDQMNAELHLVDLPTGDVTTIGRRGDGPGEFHLLLDVMRTRDGFAAWDAGLARITMFSKTGDVAESWSYNRMWFNQPIAAPVAVLSDGAVVFRDGAEPAERQGRFRDETRYVEVARDGIAGMVTEALGREYWSGKGGFQPVMFGHLLLEAQIGDQIAVSQTDLGTVRIVSREGEVSAELRLGQEKRPSASQVETTRENARKQLRLRIERDERRPNGAVFRQINEAKLADVDDVPMNETSPPIDAMFVDMDGRLWLRAYAMPDDDGSRWQVWNPNNLSRPQAVLVVQADKELLDASGTYVVLHERDAMGIDRVLVVALVEED